MCLTFWLKWDSYESRANRPPSLRIVFLLRFSCSLAPRARAMDGHPSNYRLLASQILERVGISEQEVLGNLTVPEVSDLLVGESFGTNTWDAILEIREVAVAVCDDVIRKASKGLVSSIKVDPPPPLPYALLTWLLYVSPLSYRRNSRELSPASPFGDPWGPRLPMAKGRQVTRGWHWQNWCGADSQNWAVAVLCGRKIWNAIPSVTKPRQH